MINYKHFFDPVHGSVPVQPIWSEIQLLSPPLPPPCPTTPFFCLDIAISQHQVMRGCIYYFKILGFHLLVITRHKHQASMVLPREPLQEIVPVQDVFLKRMKTRRKWSKQQACVFHTMAV